MFPLTLTFFYYLTQTLRSFYFLLLTSLLLTPRPPPPLHVVHTHIMTIYKANQRDLSSWSSSRWISEAISARDSSKSCSGMDMLVSCVSSSVCSSSYDLLRDQIRELVLKKKFKKNLPSEDPFPNLASLLHILASLLHIFSIFTSVGA